MFRTLIAAGAFTLALALVVAPTMAAAETPAEDQVQLTISVIHATKGKAGIDPSLKPITRDLRRAFAAYSTFKRVDRQELQLKKGAAQTLELPNGQASSFEYRGADPKKADGTPLHRVKLSIPKSELNVSLRAPAGKVFYQAGLGWKDGIIILAMMFK